MLNPYSCVSFGNYSTRLKIAINMFPKLQDETVCQTDFSKRVLASSNRLHYSNSFCFNIGTCRRKENVVGVMLISNRSKRCE